MVILLDHRNIPAEIAAIPNWVCWRMEPDKKTGRATKVPYNPHTGYKASSNDPQTWGTLAQALEGMARFMFTGVGFVFTEEIGYVGIDIDGCLDENKQPNKVAAAILAKTPPTYIEITPSGRGLHIFLRGRLSKGGMKSAKHGVEMYAKARYFTMTGNKYSSCVNKIADDNGVLEFIQANFIASAAKTKKKSTTHPGRPLADDELLDLAKSSKDGAAFTSLWDGVWAGNYPSQSEADFALCRKLAFWSGRNEAQVDRLFRQSGLFREKWDRKHNADGSTYGETTVSRACEGAHETYTPPPKQQIDVFEHSGAYWRNRNQKVYALTNWIVVPVEMICSDEETQITCDLVTLRGETFRQVLMTSDFANLQRFKNILNKKTIALTFKGSEGDLELLKEFIYDLKWVRKKGVKALGLYPYRRKIAFVTPETAVLAGGKHVNDLVQLERYRSIESTLLEYPIITREQMLQLGELLMAYNEPAKVVTVLAWSAACFIKSHLRKNKIKFPHLFLIGEAGSGKSSTLEHVVLPMFGRSKVTASGQVTNFTLMWECASSNIIPQAFDEFKPSKLDKQRLNWLYNHFRDSYDKHEGIRGRADQTTVTYELIAPIVVSGEESADEAAVRERCLELLFSKKDMGVKEYNIAHDTLEFEHEETLGSFGRGLLDMALQTTIADAKAWHVEGKGYFSDNQMPSRVKSNLACAYAGLCFVLELCGQLGLGWSDVFPFDREACVGYLDYAAKEYLLDGGPHNKSIVEQTFEVMSRMKLKAGDDFAFENGDRHLCLCMNSVYDRYTRYRR
ncbi:MAG: DNA primase, partial [Clostridiales bacterium]|nr:DNA primase [Clostridiales bacterium]